MASTIESETRSWIWLEVQYRDVCLEPCRLFASINWWTYVNFLHIDTVLDFCICLYFSVLASVSKKLTDTHCWWIIEVALQRIGVFLSSSPRVSRSCKSITFLPPHVLCVSQMCFITTLLQYDTECSYSPCVY
jgi:hypothetical protein